MSRTTRIITLGALSVAVNVVAGTVIGALKIPFLFLDTVGTIFSAALFGPWWGALVGLLTNLVLGVTNGPTEIPFALVNIVVGLIVGYAARWFGFKFPVALVVGLLVGVVAPVIGTVIAVGVFGGLTGGAQDVFVLWLQKAGSSLIESAFWPRLIDNLLDKVLSALLVYGVLKALPASFKEIPKPKAKASTSASA